MKRLRLAVLPLIILLSACPETEYGGSGGSVPIENLEDAFVAAYCKALRECEIPNSSVQVIGAMARAGGDCEGFLRKEFDTSNIAQAAEDGSVQYDPVKARECLDALSEQCLFESGYIPACRDAFRGVLEEGDNCADSDYCGPGLYCNSDPADRCEWVCTAAPRVGESCAEAYRCADEGDQYGHCNYNDECVLVSPTTASERGGSCNRDPEDGQLRHCPRGSWCDDGTCRAPLALGSDCPDDDVVCAGDALCVQGQCRALRVLNAAGDDCAQDLDNLRICNQLRHLACDPASRKCVQIEPLAEGELCDVDGAGDCDAGLFCDYDQDEPVCVGPKDNGERCDYWDDECKSDYCTNEGVCAPAPVCQ